MNNPFKYILIFLFIFSLCISFAQNSTIFDDVRFLPPIMHNHELKDLQISPKGDVALSIGSDPLPKVWDLKTGKLKFVLKGHHNWVTVGIFDHSGDRIFTGGDDNRVLVWDAETGKLLKEFNDFDDFITHIAISEKYDVFITATYEDRSIKLWDYKSGQLIKKPFRYSFFLRDLHFFDQGRKMIFAHTNSQFCKVSDQYFGKIIGTEKQFPFGISAVGFSEEKGIFATADHSNKIIRVWRSIDLKPLKQLEAASEKIKKLVFNLGASKLLSLGDDNGIQLWDFQADTLMWSKDGNEYGIYDAVFNRNYKVIFAGGFDNKLFEFDLESGELIKAYDFKSPINFIKYHPNEELLLIGGLANKIALFDIPKRQFSKHFTGTSNKYQIPLINADQSNQFFTNDAANGFLWDQKEGEIRKDFNSYNRVLRSGRTFQFDKTGKLLLNRYRIRKVDLIDVDSLQVLKKFSKHRDRISMLSFHPSGKSFAITAMQPSAAIYDSKTFEELATIQNGKEKIEFIDHSPDGKIIVSYGNRKKTRFWNSLTGELIREIVDGNSGNQVKWLGFSGDSKFYTIQQGKQLDLYSNENHQILFSWPIEKKWGMKVHFNPDTTRLLASYSDNEIKIWNTKSGKEEYSYKTRTKTKIRDVFFINQGKDIALLTDDNVLKIIDPNVNVVVLKFTDVEIMGLQSPGTLVTRNTDLSLNYIDLKTGELMYILYFFNDNHWILLSPDRLSFDLSSEEILNRINYWNTDRPLTEQEIKEIFYKPGLWMELNK